MIFRNLVSSTRPVVLHAPGLRFHPDLRLLFSMLCRRLRAEPTVQTRLPDAQIVTWNTNTSESPLEASLARLGLTCERLTCAGRWANTCKFTALAEYVKRVESPYVIGIDAFDAIVTEDLAPMVKWFSESGLGMLMNAERRFWPYCGAVAEACQFQEGLSGDNRYLNSGAWIARTDYLRDVFLPTYFSVGWEDIFPSEGNYVSQIEKEYGPDCTELESVRGDDQIFCHLAFRELHPAMQLDYQNRFFQIVKTWEPSAFNLSELGIRLEPPLQ